MLIPKASKTSRNQLRSDLELSFCHRIFFKILAPLAWMRWSIAAKGAFSVLVLASKSQYPHRAA